MVNSYESPRNRIITSGDFMKKRLAVTLCSLFVVGMFTGTTMALEPDPWENNQKNKIENPAATKTLKKGGNITREPKR